MDFLLRSLNLVIHQYENFDESTEKFEYYLELAPENRDEQFYKANPEFYEVFDYLPPQNL